MASDERPTTPARLRARALSAGSSATAVTRSAGAALVEAVGALAHSAIDRVLLSGDRVTSAAEAQRLLEGEDDTEELADKIQRVVVLAVPVVRVVARGARFTRLPWVMLASSSVSIGLGVRTGVRELQLLASLVAYRIEEATGEPADHALVEKAAIDLYLHPGRTPDLSNDKLHLVKLTRKWVLRGAFGRNTAKRAAKALEAAELLDGKELAARWRRHA
jgi:hypothetical protein